MPSENKKVSKEVTLPPRPSEEPQAAPEAPAPQTANSIPMSRQERAGGESPSKMRLAALVQNCTAQVVGVTGSKRYPEVEAKHPGAIWCGTHYINTGRSPKERDDIDAAVWEAGAAERAALQKVRQGQRAANAAAIMEQLSN